MCDANGRRNGFRFFNHATMKYRRSMFRLNSNHPRDRARFAKLFVFGISGGVGRKISGIPEWKNVDIRHISEFIDDFERSSFLSSDPVGVNRIHDSELALVSEFANDP